MDELINEQVSALNDKFIVGEIFHLVKAIDCFIHILLSNLNFYKITDNAYEWIKSYFIKMYQRVKIKNKNFSHKTFSDWGFLEHSVSQESILVSLLFLFA
jgi:hypothetical protein